MTEDRIWNSEGGNIQDPSVTFILRIYRPEDRKVNSVNQNLKLPSPYPRRFGNVSDIAGMNVTSIKAINIAR